MDNHSENNSPRTYTLEELYGLKFSTDDSQDQTINDQTFTEEDITYLLDAGLSCVPGTTAKADDHDNSASITTVAAVVEAAAELKVGSPTKEEEVGPTEIDVNSSTVAATAIDEFVNHERAMVVWIPQEAPVERAILPQSTLNRLLGWKIRKITRYDNIRTDKFYVHLSLDIQFRSLNEVDDFVHLGVRPRRSKKEPKMTMAMSPEGKRSHQRKRLWEFRPNGRLTHSGDIIYDIHFFQPCIYQYPNRNIYVNTGSRASSERTMSTDNEEKGEEVEIVEEFLHRAWMNLMNKDKKRKRQEDEAECSYRKKPRR